jgi:parallel beta-helix repeat protein
MRLKALSGIVLALLLIGMLTLAFNIQPVKSNWTWTETIYIRADGIVEPDTALISSVDNITYTLTDNIVGDIPADASAIVVERNNIVVDGAGYTVQGIGNGTGVYWSGINNVTIKNTNINNFWIGISLNSTSSNVISGNSITNNYISIYFRGSLNNTISENSIANNEDSIMLDWSSNNTIFKNNITNNGHGIYFYDSNYNNISGNTLTNENNYGIWLKNSPNNIIFENNVTKNQLGVRLYESPNNIIQGNNVTANTYYGIWLEYSSSNFLRANKMAGNTYNLGVDGTASLHFVNDIDSSNMVDGKPIYYWVDRRDVGIPLDAGFVILVNCTNIRIENLTLTKNGQGILLANTVNSIITGNNITNNGVGVHLFYSASNSIYHNNFIDNTVQVTSEESANIWDAGYPSGGNYWSDYTGVDNKSGPNQNQLGRDGMGDTPYTINASDIDRYPLMKLWPCKITPPNGGIQIALALTIILAIVAIAVFVKYKKKQ